MPTVTSPRSTWSHEDKFFAGMALAILLSVVLGFGRTFFLRPWFPEVPAPPERFFILHGAAFTGWVLLLVIQPTLVAMRRVDLHRALGKAGAVLALLMVVLGVGGALLAARRDTGFVGLPVPALQFLLVPLTDMLLFGTFVALGIARRKDTPAHQRLMLLATFNLLSAAIARWPFALMSPPNPLIFFAITDIFLVALAAWDFSTRGRLHPVTLWGGLVFVLSQPLRLMLSGTAAWMALAGWLVRL